MRVGAVVAQWQSTEGSSQRCPGFDSCRLPVFSLTSIFASEHPNSFINLIGFPHSGQWSGSRSRLTPFARQPRHGSLLVSRERKGLVVLGRFLCTMSQLLWTQSDWLWSHGFELTWCRLWNTNYEIWESILSCRSTGNNMGVYTRYMYTSGTSFNGHSQ